jgi:CspA family cold shock protein
MNKREMLTISNRPVQRGVVKWFDAAKGFGFVVAPEVETDILIHSNQLTTLRRTTLTEGSTVDFRYTCTEQGLRVTEVIEVNAPVLADEAPLETEFDQVSDEILPARVKWFDPGKGFGFVNCFDEGEDIFVGSAVLAHAAIAKLSIGEALAIQIGEVDGRRRVYRIHEWS